MRIFDVEFAYNDEGIWNSDYVRFDISDGPFSDMMTDIARLFGDYCGEHGFSPAFMTNICEVVEQDVQYE